MQNIIKNMLLADLQAQRQKAITTMYLLSNHPAGIGDHSTDDFYKNAHEALAALTDADDKIETLEKYDFIIKDGKNVTLKNGKEI